MILPQLVVASQLSSQFVGQMCLECRTYVQSMATGTALLVATIAEMAVHPCADVFAFGFQRPALVSLIHGVHLCSDRHAR